MSSSISEIEAELAQSRAALRTNLSALAERLTVGHVVGDVLLTRRTLTGVAKVAAPFVAAGIAGAILKYATSRDDAVSGPHLPDDIRTRWHSLVSRFAASRPSSHGHSGGHPLLLAAVALAAGGAAAALLPVTGRERRAVRAPLRYAATRTAQATRIAANEAYDVSEKAARLADHPDQAPAASS